jgi:hypothetical protein
MHENYSFPRWAAPFVAAALVGFSCLKIAGLPGALIGAAAGFGLGLVVYLLDQPASTESNLEAESDSGNGSETPAVSATLVGRFLALLSLLLFYFPILGLILSLVAVFMNRGTQGWSLAVSYVCLILASLINITFLVLFVIIPPH